MENFELDFLYSIFQNMSDEEQTKVISKMENEIIKFFLTGETCRPIEDLMIETINECVNNNTCEDTPGFWNGICLN